MLQRHAYKVFLTAFLTGSFAFQVQSIAVAWQVFSIRHSPLDLGLVGLASFLPTFAFAIPAGFTADRYSRKMIALLAALGALLCSLALVGLVIVETRSIVPYLLVELFLGTVRAFGGPAEGTLLVSIIPAASYVKASAHYSSLRQIIAIGGPALGGVLFAFGPAAAFSVASAMSAVSLAALVFLAVERLPGGSVAPTLRDAFEGVRFIFGRETLVGAMSLDLIAVLLGGATALLPVYADVILHLGPSGLGALRSAPALGAAVMGYFLSRMPPERRIGRTLLVAVAGFGIATIVFGLSRSFLLSMVALVFVGATDMVSMVIRDGLTQLNTPDAMRGRVNAAEGVFIGASNQLGAFESGTLAAAIGTVPAVVAGGVATLVVILLWTWFFPGLVRADRYVERGPSGPAA